MSDLTRFRDHCRTMATAEHKPECPSLTAREPWWPGWDLIDEDGNWCARSGKPSTGMGWLGPKPKWEPPTCDGCLTDADRALFASMAGEVNDYLAPQVDLFGDVTSEPTLEDA